MKLAYVLLGLFFLVVTVRSDGRELLFTEKAVILPLKKTMKVRSYMLEKVNIDDLSMIELITWRLFKKSCLPIEKSLEKIKGEGEKFPDYSAVLMRNYVVCSEGVISMTHHYVKQNL